MSSCAAWPRSSRSPGRPALITTAQQFAELRLQIRPAQVPTDDLSVGIDEIVLGDALYVIFHGYVVVPVFQIADLCPGQSVIFDGLEPGFPGFVQGDAQHGEILA